MVSFPRPSVIAVFMLAVSAVGGVSACASHRGVTVPPGTVAAGDSTPRPDSIAMLSDSVPMMVVDSAHLHTGIVGEVRMRPVRPIGDDGVIVSAPLPGATILVADMDDKVIGSVKSGPDGRFYLELRQGTHYLRPQLFRGKMFPHPLESQRMYVTQGQVLHVLIEYDTGIR